MSIISTLSAYVLLGIIFSYLFLGGEYGQEKMEECSEKFMFSMNLLEVVCYFVFTVFWLPVFIFLVKEFAVTTYYYFALSEEEFDKKYEDEDDEE